jgi:peptide chain release factor
MLVVGCSQGETVPFVYFVYFVYFAGRNRYAPAMSTFPVGPDKEAQLAQRMAALGLREADIEETFVRSGGHGGQNVNKTATCVMLLHRPSGLQVKCQATRQQGLNRFIARRLLLDKIEQLRTGRVAAQRAEMEKVRRQKRRRSRRARQRMLADKAHHAAKKEGRRPVSRD